MFYLILVLIISIILLFLLTKLKIKLMVSAIKLNSTIKIGIGPFGGLIYINAKFFVGAYFDAGPKIQVEPLDRLTRFAVKKSKKNTKRIPVKIELDEIKALYDRIAIEKLLISGRIGIKDDAFLTVMLNGIIKILLDIFFFYIKNSRPELTHGVAFMPVFGSDEFRIKLEGIFAITPLQIIGIIIRRIAIAKKGNKNNVTSNRKHYENQHGANQRNGGRKHHNRQSDNYGA